MQVSELAALRLAALRVSRPVHVATIEAMAADLAHAAGRATVEITDVNAAEERHDQAVENRMRHKSALRAMAEQDDDLLTCDRCGRVRWVNAVSSCFICHEAGRPETFCTDGCWAAHQSEQHTEQQAAAQRGRRGSQGSKRPIRRMSRTATWRRLEAAIAEAVTQLHTAEQHTSGYEFDATAETLASAFRHLRDALELNEYAFNESKRALGEVVDDLLDGALEDNDKGELLERVMKPFRTAKGD